MRLALRLVGGGCRLDVFHVHPVGGVLARIAGGAVGRFFAVAASFLEDLPEKDRRENRRRCSHGFPRSSCWRQSTASSRECPRRRNRGRWWAGRKSACGPPSRPPCESSGQSSCWWCRAQWSRRPGSHVCLQSGCATAFSFSFTPKSRTDCCGSMKVRPM